MIDLGKVTVETKMTTVSGTVWDSMFLSLRRPPT